MRNEDLERAKAVKRRHADGLMALPNVVGVGIGELAGGPVIRVYVRAYERWDGPYELEGIPVMTEVVGDIKAL